MFFHNILTIIEINFPESIDTIIVIMLCFKLNAFHVDNDWI